MGFKSLLVHYQNKYPLGQVFQTENSLDVFSGGRHCVALRKNGAGQIVDKSEEAGCCDRHDLAPLPKECRFRKLYQDGRIGNAEEHAERLPKAVEAAGKNGGRVPSIDELERTPKA